MSLRMVSLMVHWAVTADAKTSKLLDELATLPMDSRKRDPRLIQIVAGLKEKWSTSKNRIERLASLGWLDYESECIFAEMIDSLPKLRKEYLEQVMLHGLPDLSNDKFNEFEKAVKEP